MNFNSIARYTNDVMTPHGSRGLSLTQRAGGRNKYTAMDMIQGSQTLNPDLQAQNNFEQMRSQYAMAGQSQLFDESGLSPMLSGSRPASNSVSGIHRRGFTKSSTQLKEAVSALKKRATSPLLHPQITELLVALNDTVMGPEIVKMYQTSNKPLEDVIKEVIRHYKGIGTGPSPAIRSAPSLPPRFIGSSTSCGWVPSEQIGRQVQEVEKVREAHKAAAKCTNGSNCGNGTKCTKLEEKRTGLLLLLGRRAGIKKGHLLAPGFEPGSM